MQEFLEFETCAASASFEGHLAASVYEGRPAPDLLTPAAAGDRTVTRESYAAEINKIREERPNIRVVVYDHSFEGDRAWFSLCVQVA